ncbi:DUF6415 family natural product biosynthesis protein [Streptomyces sp. NPDC087901]|uniref:DUF6415 family natural product biosynthesis protein n=1 Tax=Streptomyces sp. NPDC087901 TaxID=3365818 RepID=UPI00382EF5D3
MCDDLNRVFDEQSFPDEDQVDELTLRLRGALMRLIAAADVQRSDTQVSDAIVVARERLNQVRIPTSRGLQPKVVLVRLANAVSDLLDALSTGGLLKLVELPGDPVVPPPENPSPAVSSGCAVPMGYRRDGSPSPLGESLPESGWNAAGDGLCHHPFRSKKASTAVSGRRPRSSWPLPRFISAASVSPVDSGRGPSLLLAQRP